jgi:hypothetical protein
MISLGSVGAFFNISKIEFSVNSLWMIFHQFS